MRSTVTGPVISSRRRRGAGRWIEVGTPVGRALKELSIQMIPAYSPPARGRSERRFGTWQGRLPQELGLAGITTLEGSNRFLRERYIAEMNRKFAGRAAEPGHAFVPVRGQDLDQIFSAQTERTTRWGGGAARADRADAMAGDAGRLPRDHLRASGWAGEHSLRAARGGTVHGPWRSVAEGGRGRRRGTGCLKEIAF